MDDEGLTIQEPSGGRGVLSKQLTGDRYRVGPPLAKGGMGEVLEAEDVQVGRHVAIKRMLAKDPSDRSIARFIREAQIQGRLDHPSIVPVHEIGRDHDGRPFFAMKKLHGITLADIVGKPELSAKHSQQKLLRAFVDICLAIELAHTRGIVHRDLKPANIMLGDFGEVYVLDWGVAKIIGVPDEETSDSSDDNLTMAGAAIGTPGFMSPEQINDASVVDARADIYALGCLLFEILTREPLHPRGRSGLNSALAGTDARASKRAPDRNIAPELDQLCVEATVSAPENRRITARELGDRVQAYLDGDRDLERRNAIAREHLETARTALAKLDALRGDTADDEVARATAMREAGRALALDPKLAGAAEIISRLMLEPPRSVPAEVEAEIAAEATDTDRRHINITKWLVFTYIGFIPYLAIARPWPYVTALCAILLLQITMLNFEARSLRFRAPIVIIRNAIIIAILARAFSPFLLAPGIAAMTTTVLLFGMTFHRARFAVALSVAMAAAVLLPWLGEVTGVLSETMLISTDQILFSFPNDGLSEWPRHLGLVLYLCALITAGASLAWRMLGAERASRRRLYLQAWQLKQLVATS